MTVSNRNDSYLTAAQRTRDRGEYKLRSRAGKAAAGVSSATALRPSNNAASESNQIRSRHIFHGRAGKCSQSHSEDWQVTRRLGNIGPEPPRMASDGACCEGPSNNKQRCKEGWAPTENAGMLRYPLSLGWLR